ncbi:hypothetical protein NPX13_g5372 [Xylaria arbuscula]|uniref:Uncharacterized protein n=1 Tax=Xylaria arbuscula TaxID=114810 RepID=A0A9W8TLC7_9PEZI|nr:hypothetical protein NPX13_g5372 [Xylaria arbuscula]
MLQQLIAPWTGRTRDSQSATKATLDNKGTSNVTTQTEGKYGEPHTAELLRSSTKTIGDTFIANVTTLSRLPLTTPSALANQTNPISQVPASFSMNTTNLDNVTTSGRFTNSSTAVPSTSVTTPTTTANDLCTSDSYGPFTTVIEYSIIHTWTITWYGNPADYTPPYPTISTPKPCTPTTSATVCDSSGQSCSLGTTEPWWFWTSDASNIRGMEPTLTFVTTDKNPAVVFPTSPPPDYGGSPDPMGNVHSAPYPNQIQSSDAPSYGNGAATDQDIKSTPVAATTSPVTVTIKPSVVVIDDQTFTDNPAKPTSIVVVDQHTFTINPTQVVGVGVTVTRPAINSPRAVTPQATKTTTIGDIGVAIIGGSSVVIDRTTFTIGSRPTTAIIKGQTITLGPGAVVFPSQTLAIPAAQDTTQVVFGAELITTRRQQSPRSLTETRCSLGHRV